MIIANNELLSEYLPIMVFFGIACFLALLVAVLPKFMAKEKPEKDKLIGYECGFDPFGDARGKFDVRFYLVAILFIIFDLEVTFLIPWAITLKGIGAFGFWSMMVFLLVLTAGFIYEWQKGALDWE